MHTNTSTYTRRSGRHLASEMDPNVTETTVLVSNLHCGSCVQTIEEVLMALDPPPLSIDVSIVSQSVTVHHDTGLASSDITSSIDDAGFDIVRSPPVESNSLAANISDLLLGRHGKHIAQCTSCQAGEFHVTEHSAKQKLSPHIQSILTPNEAGPFRLLLSVGGMTCASCSSTITRLVSEIDGASDVAVNLMGHSAKVIINRQKISEIVLQTIEDAGFEAEVVKLEPISDRPAQRTSSTRTVSLRVDGMFCQNCPSKVMDALQLFQGDVTISKPLTTPMDPILKFTYTPNPPSFTLRTIINAISSSQSPPFEVSVYHPLTLEERAEKMQYVERRALLLRLVFSVLIAIPTFIIGIVYMSLVPHNNSTRIYLMQPILNGMVSRIEWSLFFLATPVMFWSAGLFHRRSLREIRALWKRGSKTPIWKRFVRFGSMNLLVSGGVSVAYFSSIVLLGLAASQSSVNAHGQGDTTTYFDSVVFLTMFLLAGRYLEAYSKGHTANAVKSLGKLRPSQALVLSTVSSSKLLDRSSQNSDIEKGDLEVDDLKGMMGSAFETVDATHLEVGDIVRVRNGSSPPADGTIVFGETFFDESSLTGESRPIKKKVGEPVFLGTINQGRPVDIRIDVVGGETMLDRIVDVVREGQTHRAPIERVADLITGWFVPVVTLLSILTWVIWLSLGFSGALPADYLDIEVGGWTVWSLQFSIAVFVVACPCGIGLAAPTALLVGSGLAAQFGILVRGGGEAFQECAQLDAVVFDKTGTLTEGGQPKVTDVEFLGGPWKREALLGLIGVTESATSHPVAGAIHHYCDANGATSVSLSEVEETPGRGMKARVVDSTIQEIIVGNASWMEEHEVVLGGKSTAYLHSWQEQGKSVVLVAVREEKAFVPVFLFAIADSLRPEAKQVIKSLQSRGLGTWMLSGDNSTTAKAVARLVGIPVVNVIAGVLPHEKAQKIQWIQKNGSKKLSSKWRQVLGLKRLNERCIVAMIGDGINDAAALVAADVGIAVGSGSDVAISSASFILLSSNLQTLLTLTDLSQTVFNRVKINFLWAGVYNIIAVPIAAGVIYPIGHARLDPVWASLAMALSSVSVVCSSLMLKLYKEPKT